MINEARDSSSGTRVAGSGAVAALTFFTGTMDSGKSTLALQTDHNRAARGLTGLIFTCRDRAGAATLSSRLGLEKGAIEVDEALDLREYVVAELTRGVRVDYVVCDEAQFYSPAQIEQLAAVVDELGIDVFCFGILTDFRTRLFPGTGRLTELADSVHVLQVEALCWCGRRATHNARTVDGAMVTEGDVVVVGDVDSSGTVGYEVLCRRHHLRGQTAAVARAASLAPDPLPFG